MPTCNPVVISQGIKMIISIQPKRILDLGVGFGKWGFLCREYLDSAEMRVRREDWKTTVDGIEGCEEYITPLIEQIYDKIYCEDIFIAIDVMCKYDLIIASNIIEHFDKQDAYTIIEKSLQRCKDMLIIIPLGKTNLIDKKHPLESHRSNWDIENFDKYGYLKREIINNRLLILLKGKR